MDKIKFIEEMSLNAWPSHKIELYDGWLIRFSHNYTYRTNSVEQVGRSNINIDEKIKYVESVYNNLHTPAVFKINPLMDKEFEEKLINKGYEKKHITETMIASLDEINIEEPKHVEYEFYQRNSNLPSIVSYENDVTVQLRDRITDDWIEGLFKLNGTTNPTLRRIVPFMYRAIPKETIVAKIEIDGRIVATGLGILDRDYVGIYAIYVDPSCRKKNFAKAIVSTLLNEAMKKGYHNAYLQCVFGNNVAKHLYEKLGFKYLYSYWFRVKEQV